MTQTVTENDLILFCYDELDQQRSTEVRKAIKHDAQLMQMYQNLLHTMQFLDLGARNPSQTSIDIIREHSGHHSSLETS